MDRREEMELLEDQNCESSSCLRVDSHAEERSGTQGFLYYNEKLPEIADPIAAAALYVLQIQVCGTDLTVLPCSDFPIA